MVRDPETRATTSGSEVTSFSVAVNYNYVMNGEKKEQVSYIEVSAWGKPGNVIAQYAKKGTPIMVSGRLSQRTYEDKTGVKRSAVEIVMEDFNLLGSRSQESTTSSYSQAMPDSIPDDIPDGEIDLSEVPF